MYQKNKIVMFEVHSFIAPCHCGGSFRCIVDTLVHNDWDDWFLSVIKKENTPQIICNKCNVCADYSQVLERLKEMNYTKLQNLHIDSMREFLSVQELPIPCNHCDKPFLCVINTAKVSKWWDFYVERTGLPLICVQCDKINLAEHFRKNHLFFKEDRLAELKRKNKMLYDQIKADKDVIDGLYKQINNLKSKNTLRYDEIQHNKKIMLQIRRESGDLENANDDDTPKEFFTSKSNNNDDDNNYESEDIVNVDYDEEETRKEYNRLYKKKVVDLKKIATKEKIKDRNDLKLKDDIICAIMRKKGYELECLFN